MVGGGKISGGGIRAAFPGQVLARRFVCNVVENEYNGVDASGPFCVPREARESIMASGSPESKDYHQILKQHQAIKALLARLDKLLKQETATVEEVAQLLGELGDRLVKHFATEEEGGCFSEALMHAPRLISRANELMAQHPKMTAEAQQLSADLQSVRGSANWREETRKRFEAFRRELTRHEQSEDRLLQEAYTRDIGAAD
jgi:hypothetical protein